MASGSEGRTDGEATDIRIESSAEASTIVEAIAEPGWPDSAIDCSNDTPSGTAGDLADDGGQVVGIVVAKGWGRGAPGRTVVVAGRSTTTDANGGFSFSRVPRLYDAIIAEPDGTRISVYYGLSRRDPVLAHEASYSSDLDDPPHKATVSGTLSGAFPFPANSANLATVFFFGDRGTATWRLGQPLQSAGPDYGPVNVRWVGDPSVNGTLVVLGQTKTDSTGGASSYAGSAPLSLVADEALRQDLALSSIPIGSIGGVVTMVSGDGVEAVSFTYHLPGTRGEIDLGQCQTTGAYNCHLPDLATLGGDYCMSTVDLLGYARVTKCGGAIGMRNFSVSVAAPPQIRTPTNGTPITKSSSLAWSAVAGAVYVLDVGPDFPTSTAPHVRAYTSTTQLRWPDLQGLGVPFPGGSTYSCRVTALLPYVSTDDLASPRGPAAEDTDQQELDSASVEFPLLD